MSDDRAPAPTPAPALSPDTAPTRTSDMTPQDRLAALRRATDARILAGRAGAGSLTATHLTFSLDHARARDAVWSAMDADGLAADLEAAGQSVLRLTTQAPDRATYVRRPDLGRKLSDESTAVLGELAGDFDVALIVADGLSATAIDVNAAEFLIRLIELIKDAGLSLAPVSLVEQGRVAVGDPVGAALGARVTVVVIGERPGLSAADSLGCYLTYGPAPGTPDSRRNCISNIRSGGQSIEAAAAKALWLIQAMLRQRISGVALKDESHLSAPDPHAVAKPPPA